MIMELLKIIRGLLKNSFLISLFLLHQQVNASITENGVAVEPMELTVKENKNVYFTVYNDTESDYIVSSKIIIDSVEDDSNKSKINAFFVNPPLRLLKKRAYEKLGVIYLPNKTLDKRKKYYLSVSFIPKTPKKDNVISVPIILVQQIPIKFE
ncbi:fimbria/pilus periplasmic chaperone [Escherichia albertii]|uniref:fimbria/pilus periplasmic chaperone n=1 Tax=Escherichia albertii TaxID=208962 RepID=UPI0032B852A3